VGYGSALQATIEPGQQTVALAITHTAVANRSTTLNSPLLKKENGYAAGLAIFGAEKSEGSIGASTDGKKKVQFTR